MVQVTGGRVGYSRTVQPAQYESKRAEVELSFVLDEGEDMDTALQDLGQACRDEALALVGLRKRGGVGD